MAVKTIGKCSKCGYPLAADYVGEKVTCPNCGTINEAISGVTIPTPVFVGIACFFGGLLLGPSLLAATEGGKKMLERAIKTKMA
jgi:phage FluMu protein Com